MTGFINFSASTFVALSAYYLSLDGETEDSRMLKSLGFAIIFGIIGGLTGSYCHKFAFFMIGFFFGMILFGGFALHYQMGDSIVNNKLNFVKYYLGIYCFQWRYFSRSSYDFDV